MGILKISCDGVPLSFRCCRFMYTNFWQCFLFSFFSGALSVSMFGRLSVRPLVIHVSQFCSTVSLCYVSLELSSVGYFTDSSFFNFVFFLSFLWLDNRKCFYFYLNGFAFFYFEFRFLVLSVHSKISVSVGHCCLVFYFCCCCFLFVLFLSKKKDKDLSR